MKCFNIKKLYGFLLVLYQEIHERKIQTGACVLTYYTLLAFVPILTFIMAVAKGFLLQVNLGHWILFHFEGENPLFLTLVGFAQNTLKNANRSILLVFSTLLMLWSGGKILVQMDSFMNHIWGLTPPYHMRKLRDYLAIVFFCPLFVFFSLVLTAYSSVALSDLGKEEGFLPHLAPLLIFLLNLIPFILTWLLLTFIYFFIPRVSVKFLIAFQAALITALFYQFFQWSYVNLQLIVSHHNPFYGTLAAVPLFLIWVHLNWVIIFVGCGIASSLQKRRLS